MKKIVLAITLLTMIIILAGSCTSGQKCAAYGERQRYQIDRTR